MVRGKERKGSSYITSLSLETIAHCAEGLREETPDMVVVVAESKFYPAVAKEQTELTNFRFKPELCVQSLS